MFTLCPDYTILCIQRTSPHAKVPILLTLCVTYLVSRAHVHKAREVLPGLWQLLPAINSSRSKLLSKHGDRMPYSSYLRTPSSTAKTTAACFRCSDRLQLPTSFGVFSGSSSTCYKSRTFLPPGSRTSFIRKAHSHHLQSKPLDQSIHYQKPILYYSNLQATIRPLAYASQKIGFSLSRLINQSKYCYMRLFLFWISYHFAPKLVVSLVTKTTNLATNHCCRDSVKVLQVYFDIRSTPYRHLKVCTVGRHTDCIQLGMTPQQRNSVYKACVSFWGIKRHESERRF